ncbi:unnamed protein product [Peronospora effusa]|nr:unnamed protein product [Peronospora effusa]
MKKGVDTQKVTGKEASPHLDNKDVTTEPKIARPDAKEDNVVKPTETTKEVTGKQNSVPEEDNVVSDANVANTEIHIGKIEDHLSPTQPTVKEENVVEPKSGENAEIHAGEGENDVANLRYPSAIEKGINPMAIAPALKEAALKKRGCICKLQILPTLDHHLVKEEMMLQTRMLSPMRPQLK